MTAINGKFAESYFRINRLSGGDPTEPGGTEFAENEGSHFPVEAVRDGYEKLAGTWAAKEDVGPARKRAQYVKQAKSVAGKVAGTAGVAPLLADSLDVKNEYMLPVFGRVLAGIHRNQNLMPGANIVHCSALILPSVGVDTPRVKEKKARVLLPRGGRHRWSGQQGARGRIPRAVRLVRMV